MDAERSEDYTARIRQALSEANVLSIFFVRVGQSLILDFRPDADGGGMVMIDDMVATPNDRLQSFLRLRPELPVPDELTLVPWTSAVRIFAEGGVFEAMMDRCRLEGGLAMEDAAARGYRRLCAKEREQLRDMVRGIGMETIWKRPDD